MKMITVFLESMMVIITIFSPTGEDEMHVLRLKKIS